MMMPEQCRIDVELLAAGDHHHHYFDTALRDGGITISYDAASQVVNLFIDEFAAKDLYFWLLEIIPRLQRDRR